MGINSLRWNRKAFLSDSSVNYLYPLCFWALDLARKGSSSALGEGEGEESAMGRGVVESRGRWGVGISRKQDENRGHGDGMAVKT